MRAFFYRIFPAILLLELCLAQENVKNYCIIGAGPAGLQLGYFMERAKRDYIIYEKTDVPGSFFTLYPRHQKLISINKFATGRTNEEFNLRHDWNSLISDDPTLLLKHYSREYFPQSDDYLKYLADFQRKLKIKVQWNTEVSNISMGSKSDSKLGCNYHMILNSEQKQCCRSVIIATGISKPNILAKEDRKVVEGYESMTIDPTNYTDQNVLILGRGNSGMEVAASLYGHAAFIHIIGRTRVKLSWDTHYVGDVRAINNELLDAYMLKSLDGLLEGDVENVEFQRTSKGKLQIKITESRRDNFAGREGYDRIIRCLGFKWDSGIFDKKIQRDFEQSSGSSKYPTIKPNYESLPNLFFAGTLTHSLDYRKAAGGFIHGFRYTSRVLFRLLEWRYEGVKWPSLTSTILQMPSLILKRANEASGIYQMFSTLADVIIINHLDNTVEYLEEFPAKLLADFESVTGHAVTPGVHSVLVLMLEYGQDYSVPGRDTFQEERVQSDPANAHLCHFLHPVIYGYRKLTTEHQMKHIVSGTLPPPDAIHHIVEDFTTIFDAPKSHLQPLRRFLESFVGHDLRAFSPEHCLTLALTSTQTPLGCAAYYASQ